MKNNWPTKKLGEICEVIGGGTPSTRIDKYWGDDYFWITPKDLGQITTIEVSESGRKISKAGLKNSSAQLLPIGSVILSSRAPIGYVVINAVEIATNQGCRSFVCSSAIYNRYLYYLLKLNTDYLNSLGSGSTFREISGSRLKEVEIPLPSLEIQKKVVKKIEELFAKIDQAKSVRESVIQDTDDLIPATLSKIFEEGKLRGWEEKALGEICEIARGGSPRPIKDYLTQAEDGINWIKISDATSSTKYIYKTREKIKKEGLKKSRLVKPGDFILTNSMSFGRPYIMKTTGAIHDGWLLLRPNISITEEYLYYFLSSDEIYKQFTNLAGGAVVQNLNSELVRGVRILIPSLPEQKKIVARMDALTQKVRELQALQTQTASDLTALKQSILHQAFQGELVN